MTHQVAILFARPDSVYKTLPGCDVWDAVRDARLWPGGVQVVAHPPCRAWGRLRHQAKPRPDEKELARFAVEQVRRWGGVLEHPECSTLWPDQHLPAPGSFDAFGGWTLPVLQQWWGHRAEKATWLYIVGCPPARTPALPFVMGRAERVITNSKRHPIGTPGHRPEVTKPEREATPVAFARWLVALSRSCHPPAR